MEILVNREPLDFSLETESSVGEVVDGLADWLKSGKFAITSLDVDKTNYAIHDRETWAGIEIDTVRELSIEALPLEEVDHATIVALDQYCSLLAECLESRDPGPLAEITEELPYVRGRLAQFFPSVREDDGSVAIFADKALAAGQLPQPEAAEAVIAEIETIRALLASREREYREPGRELSLSLGQLSATADALIEVPVQLQTDRRAAAMQTIVRFTELLTRVVRLIPLAEACDERDGIDLEGARRFAEETSPHLVELKEAFEIQDTVLIGDLLEYEIAPKLQLLADLLPGGDSPE
ncbi:MAG: hypothetical protein ACOC2N_07135 [Spirochaetota bacterium]